MANRPLISAKNRDLVGSAREASAFVDQGQDLTFVPGYSDKRRRMDADLSQGREPTERLTHRLQYVTVEKANGRKDSQKISQFRALGYQPVPFDNPSSFGITEVPIQAFRNAEGHIQVGDAVLYGCDAATAARNEAHGRSAIDERTADEATSHDLRATGHSVGRDLGGVRNDLVESQTEQRYEATKGA